MQVSTANNVKVYNLSVGKTLPEWISDRKRRTLLKSDIDLRRRIELIQDFSMPTASTDVQVSTDGQYILATGVYKPRVRCYDVNQLSMKFERCLDAEAVQLTMLSEDYSKFVLLLADRHLEFHAQYGFYYHTRIPKFGRDMAYHYPSCDLYVASCCPEVYRLNLEQGRFLNSITTKASACNVCEFNSEHQLFTVGTEDGTVECWDPRSHTRAGQMSLSDSGVNFSDQEDFIPAVTALKYKDALNLAVGTATGQVLLYDLRSPRPYRVKDHNYTLPIHSLAFQETENLVLSTDSKILKIWNSNDGSAFTAVEPEQDINRLCYLRGTGLIFMATEDTKMLTYYIPSLGPAPQWCSFLDSLTEELEEDPEPTVYDDYKFVTTKDLENLGLSHLVGTNLLRAYMHGYFMDVRLYHKAKTIAQPFAYEEYRRDKIKKKIEQERANRVRREKLPKVNRQLAEKLLDDSSGKAGVSNPLKDDRFAAMFTNPDFQVEEESEEYQLLHPVVSKHERRRLEKKKKKEELQVAQSPWQPGSEETEEPEGKPSDEESSSSDDDETWKEVRRSRKAIAAAKREEPQQRKHFELKPLTHSMTSQPKHSKASLGQRLEQEEGSSMVTEQHGSILGSREMKFKPKKSEAEIRRVHQLQEHRAERRKVRRSAGSILPRTNKQPVFWRGRRVK